MVTLAMDRTLFFPFALALILHAGAATPPKHPADLYQTTNVWTLHLRFTADQWKAMEPKRTEGAGGGGGFRFRPPAGGEGRDSMLQGAPGKRNGLSSSMMGLEFEYVHADLDFGGVQLKDVGVRYKGNGTYMESQGGDKRPLKIDLNRYVKGQKLAGHTTLDLQNNTTDAAMMNDALGYRLYRDAGAPAPRTAYAKVYVDAPGAHTNRYFGLYTLVENVDAHFAKQRFGSKDGLVLKPVTSRLFSDLGDDWARYEGPYDPKTKPTAAQKKRVMELAKFVSHADDAEFAKRFGEFVDVQAFARFMAVTVWLSNFDSVLDMGQNFYVHIDAGTGKATFIPWDLDHSFGTFGMKGTQDEREQLSIWHPWTGSNRFLERAFAVEAFRDAYRAEFGRIDKTVARPERLSAQVDEVAAATRDAVKEEGEEKARRFEQSVAGEIPSPGATRGDFRGPPPGDERPRPEGRPGGGDGPRRRGGGGGFGFGASKPLKAFVVARSASVGDQLAGKSKGKEVQDRMFGGGGPGGRGGFGPGNFLAASMFSLADSDRDGKVQPSEMRALGERWFTAWDVDKEGELRQAQVSKGLNMAFPPPPGLDGPPGGGGFGPGNFVGPALLAAMDTDKDKSVSKAEFLGAFEKWSIAWDTDRKGHLDEEKIKVGLNQALGQPGGPGRSGGAAGER